MRPLIAFLLLIAVDSLYAQNHWQPANGPHSGTISIVYTLSTGEVFASDPNTALYRSSDHGDHWTAVLDKGASQIAEAPNGDVYAGCGAIFGSIYRSRDHG